MNKESTEGSDDAGGGNPRAYEYGSPRGATISGHPIPMQSLHSLCEDGDG